MSLRARAFGSWDRRRFWEVAAQGGARITRRTRQFTDSWLGLVAGADPAELAGMEAARQLVRDRERELKGPRARLQNRQALLLWRGDAGSRPMDFRWAVAQTIVNDILDGLSDA